MCGELSVPILLLNMTPPRSVALKSGSDVEYPTMKGPAVYRIRVRGTLDPEWSDRLEGMQIDNLFRKDGSAECVLEGCLVDQSAFAGVLSMLYDLHLPVISADCLGAADHCDDQ